MRSSRWMNLSFAAFVQAQSTVTLCESYSFTGTTTFTAYTTYYETADGIGASQPATSTPFSRLTSYTLPPASTSSFTEKTAYSAVGGTVVGNGTEVVVPDSPVTPPTSSPSSILGITSSTGFVMSASDTITTTPEELSTSEATTAISAPTSSVVSTNPSTTNAQFYIVFNVNTSNKRLRKREVVYLGFDINQQSIIVTDQQQAATFYLSSDGKIMTASLYVDIDDRSSPPRFSLQPTPPSSPLKIGINNGIVTVSGVDGYCLQDGNTLALVINGASPTGCQPVQPQLVAVSSSMGLSTMTSTGSTSSPMSATITPPTPASTATEQTSTTTGTGEHTTTGANISSSTTITAGGAIVTDQAYIDTVLRHHNYHRQNHTASDLLWNTSLAETARKISESCVYAHDTATDCPTSPDYACYGQNIGAGYTPLQMGLLISDGFYNSEEPKYTYYGGEPDINTLHEWGHFSQIVWKDTSSVGCYTNDCTGSGLQNIDPSTGIRPYFTVCNYGPPGNYIDEFKNNVIAPQGFETIHAGYMCPSDENCVNGST